jgi:hypothetical protein
LRLDKNSTVCGLPASQAREVMRLFSSPKPQRFLRQWANDDDALATALKDDGWFQLKFHDAEGDAWWETTTRGNALVIEHRDKTAALSMFRLAEEPKRRHGPWLNGRPLVAGFNQSPKPCS